MSLFCHSDTIPLHADRGPEGIEETLYSVARVVNDMLCSRTGNLCSGHDNLYMKAHQMLSACGAQMSS